MTTDKPSHLVPKLRFPEFRDTQGWSLSPLGEVLTPIVRERKKPTVPYTGLGIRSHGRGTFLKELEQPEKTSMERLYEVDCNDLVVNITFAWEGAIAIVRPEDTGALVSHRFPTFQFDQNAVLPEFFRYPIHDQQFIYNLGVISPGGAGRNRVLNKSDFLKIELALPEVAEQKKIADCLGSLDDLIAAEGRKLEALRQHKQGLMQQLFPQPGETAPRLRFPEFQDPLHWDTRPLRDLAHVIAGQSPSGENYNTTGNGVPFYQGKAGFGDTYLKKPTKWTTQVTKLAQPSDILMSVRAPVGALNISTEQICIGRGLASLQSRCDKWFLYYALLGQQGRIMGNGGSVFDSINKKQIEDLLIPAPPTIAEQKKIADCLGSLDDLIAAEGRKLDTLKQHKQGLLQQLFPSLDGQ